MSQPPEKPSINLSEIDPETVEIRAFVYTTKPNQIDAAVTFLNRRGWAVEIFTDVGQLVAKCFRSPPDFVLMSVVGKHKNLGSLIRLIEASFKATAVLFSETGDSKSMAVLNSFPKAHRLTSSISGPYIQRFIRSLIRNSLSEKLNEQQVHQPGSKKPGTKGTALVMESQGSSGMGFSVGVSANRGARNGAKGSAGAGSDGKPGIFYRDLGIKGPMGNEPLSADELAGFIAAQGSLKEEPASSTVATGLFPVEDQEPIVQEGIDPNAHAHNLTQEGIHSEDSPLHHEEGESESAPLIDQEREHSEGGGLSLLRGEGESGPFQLPGEGTERGSSVLWGPAGEAFAKSGSIQRIWEGLQKSISLLYDPQTPSDFRPYEFSVDQIYLSRFKVDDAEGVLVLAADGDSKSMFETAEALKRDFLGRIATRAKSYQVSKPVVLKISHQTVLDWMKNSSEMFQPLLVESMPALLSFIPFRSGVEHWDVEAKSKMKKVPLTELSPEFPLSTQTFLHLPKNDVYYLYVNRGRKIQLSQKKRLEKKGILSLYINDDKTDDFKDYQMTREIDFSLQSYKKKKSAS